MTFILKTPRPQSTHGGHHEKGFYDHEAFVYEAILPRLNSLLEQPLSPVHYHTTQDKALFLEDLSEYRVEKNEDQLGYQHCAIALETLAKLHASSFRLGQEEPHLRIRTNEKFYLNNSKYLEYLLSLFVPYVHWILKRENFSEDLIGEYLGKARQIPFELPKSVNPDLFSFSVLAHCNFITSNILFKCGPDGGPCGAKIIDFQTSAWTSPAIDIIYFAMTSMKFEIFENNFEDLLDVYVRALNEELFKIDVSDVKYSKEQLYADMENLRFYKYFTFFLLGGGLANTEVLSVDYTQNMTSKYVNERYEKVKDVVIRWLRYFQNQK